MEKSRATPDERMALTMMGPLWTGVEEVEKALWRRLARDKYARRGLKSAVAHIKRAFDVVADTMDETSLQYIQKNSEGYELVIRQRRVVKDPNWMYVKVDDLKTIISMAMSESCGMCLKSPGEVKQCKMRKALLNIIDEPQSRRCCGFMEGFDSNDEAVDPAI